MFNVKISMHEYMKNLKINLGLERNIIISLLILIVYHTTTITLGIYIDRFMQQFMTLWDSKIIYPMVYRHNIIGYQTIFIDCLCNLA